MVLDKLTRLRLQLQYILGAPINFLGRFYRDSKFKALQQHIIISRRKMENENKLVRVIKLSKEDEDILATCSTAENIGSSLLNTLISDGTREAFTYIYGIKVIFGAEKTSLEN